MMKQLISITLLAVALVVLGASQLRASGEDGHKHSETEKPGAHGSEEGGGHDEEGGAGVGPDKGVLEKGPLGIKLAPEAVKTIGAKLIPVAGPTTSVPENAVVRIKATKSVFRVRDGWYKRIPVEVLGGQKGSVTVRSEELKSTDQIVSTNAGFIRMAEVIAEEGASHSHAH